MTVRGFSKIVIAFFSRVARCFYFQTKNPKLGYILEGLGMVNAGIFMTIWNILRPFCKFNGNFSIACGSLVCLDREESGNPVFPRHQMIETHSATFVGVTTPGEKKSKANFFHILWENSRKSFKRGTCFFRPIERGGGGKRRGEASEYECMQKSFKL
jgi:hypothetical protein